MKGFLSILKAADDGVYDLFHVVVTAVIIVFLFLQVMDAAHHGWSMKTDFGSTAALVLGASAATFPIRDFGSKRDKGDDK